MPEHWFDQISGLWSTFLQEMAVNILKTFASWLRSFQDLVYQQTVPLLTDKIIKPKTQNGIKSRARGSVDIHGARIQPQRTKSKLDKGQKKLANNHLPERG